MSYINEYSFFLKKSFRPKKKIKAVFDCSNGTTGLVLESLFKKNRLMEAKIVNAEPDGNFPAHGPNPWNEGAMSDLGKKVRGSRADLGAIFDADGDRVFFVDDLGRSIDTDIVALILSKNFKGPVVLDVRAGYLARELIPGEGKKIIDSRVGHYFIKRLMRRRKIEFAAEVSGHYYFKDFFSCDSGIFASLQFINSASGIKGNLSGWIDALPRVYRVPETNFKVRDKVSAIKRIERLFGKSADRTSRLDGIKMEFSSPEWWFGVRPSNTEDLLRLNLEAKSKAVLNEKLKKLENLIRG